MSGLYVAVAVDHPQYLCLSPDYVPLEASLPLVLGRDNTSSIARLTDMAASADPNTARAESIPPAQGNYNLVAETTGYTTALYY
jgi:hypothetical protein